MNPHDINIKDLVSGGQQVSFVFYRDGSLWYEVLPRTDQPVPFQFPVPISEAGTATFHSRDTALLFMRYMRKHLETLRLAWDEQHGGRP
jgi:hypothetical protein